MTFFRSSAWRLAWWGIGGLLVAGLVMPSPTAGDALGLRRFLTPEASRTSQIAQRFRMDADGLSGIEVRAAATGPAHGRYVLTVRDLDGFGVERTAEAAATDLVRSDRYLFEFEPIEDAAGHLLEFEIAPSALDSRGVSLWATRGGRLDEGGLFINDRARWASLAFRTRTAEVASFGRFTGGAEPGRPPAWLALAGLVAMWLGVRFVLKLLDDAGVAAAHAGPPRPSVPGLLGEPVVAGALPLDAATSPPAAALGGPRGAAR